MISTTCAALLLAVSISASISAAQSPSPTWLSFVEGNPGLPGDGKLVTESSTRNSDGSIAYGGFHFSTPLSLANATNGFTFSVFYPPSETIVNFSFIYSLAPPCNINGGGFGDGSAPLSPINGSPGLYAYWSIDALESLLINCPYCAKNQLPRCSGVTLWDLSLTGIYLYTSNTVVPDSSRPPTILDAASFGFGPNAFPNACTNVAIDRSAANGQLDVSLTGDCSAAVLTIRNNKNYWTNFQVLPQGPGTTATPTTGASLYAAAGLLPPSGLFGSGTAVQYNISLAKPGAAVTIYVDPTGQTGNGYAELMNFLQVFINATPGGSIPLTLINDYQDIVQTFAQMPYFKGAAAALFSKSPNPAVFAGDLSLGVINGEVSTLTALISRVGVNNSTTTVKTILGTPWRIINTIASAFGNIYDFTFEYPTGSVLLTAQ